MFLAAAAVLLACQKTPEPSPSQDPVSPDPSEEPSKDPSEDPGLPPVVEGKVVLNGKTGFDTFAAALEAARTAGEDALFTLDAGTLNEHIVIDGEEVPFLVTIVGRTGAVLDGSIEIRKAEVSLMNFTIKPDKLQAEKPAIEIQDRNNYPFAVFVHDARYGFSMQGVTLDVSLMDPNTTALVLRGETVGEKENPDLVQGCIFTGNGQRAMQCYDAQADVLGNQFENFYKGYAVRVGEDVGDDAFYTNESGPVMTFAGNTFSSTSEACINFYSVWTADITFGNGEQDTNLKSDGIQYMYTANQAPGGDCQWKPEMLFDGKELYPATQNEMPEAELVWARRAEDSWWTTSPLPGFFNPDNGKTLDWNRSVAMDDQYVYMARQLGGEPAVFYFPIDNPGDVKLLDMTGVLADATHTVSSCQVLDDGQGGSVLLVTNLARAGQHFRVYMWRSVTSKPEVLLDYDTTHPKNPEAAARLGDKVTFNGSLQEGEIVCVNYDGGGRFWLFPIRGGKVEVPEGYFGEDGWTNSCHPASNIVGATRYASTNSYILWGSGAGTVTSMWAKGEAAMENVGTFPNYAGMFNPEFFRFGRSSYLAYASLTDGVDARYYSTIRVVKLLQNADGNDSPYVTMTTTPSDGGLVLGIGQASSEVPVADVNTNGNMVAGLAVRTIAGTTYLLGSDTNNALVLYRLK